eukprot:TRINITY_DN5099_c0_g1_i1.p1 TRINITY_DN5099_c0_g1~~TRINITY_DN5099_c0_g1_i1.p1  ORF type:complete len:101 (-),score=2.54 TRINITY_DN5099_c0_g1_i1:194-496(-)
MHHLHQPVPSHLLCESDGTFFNIMQIRQFLCDGAFHTRCVKGTVAPCKLVNLQHANLTVPLLRCICHGSFKLLRRDACCAVCEREGLAADKMERHWVATW